MIKFIGYLCIAGLTFTLGQMLQPRSFESLAKGQLPSSILAKGQLPSSILAKGQIPDLLPLSNLKRNRFKTCCKPHRYWLTRFAIATPCCYSKNTPKRTSFNTPFNPAYVGIAHEKNSVPITLPYPIPHGFSPIKKGKS